MKDHAPLKLSRLRQLKLQPERRNKSWSWKSFWRSAVQQMRGKKLWRRARERSAFVLRSQAHHVASTCQDARVVVGHLSKHADNSTEFEFYSKRWGKVDLHPLIMHAAFLFHGPARKVGVLNLGRVCSWHSHSVQCMSSSCFRSEFDCMHQRKLCIPKPFRSQCLIEAGLAEAGSIFCSTCRAVLDVSLFRSRTIFCHLLRELRNQVVGEA